ncbi:MAG: hypothetical protein U0L42_01050 [Methanobrevibacter sp.]|uniref:hypothetical protein n=1 Tax=Methanobrevibacter sp. TaxID=66852 RepID=UPI0025FA3208|nr:hypothetical protein [Methanobrevibacter sp.]MEE0934238.1 hypothetical protein [Methanobrevibacter sp.]
MRQNFTQRLEMQISQENASSGSIFMANDNDLKDFLKKHYDFPSNNLNEIKEFIEKDKELEKMVCELADTISNEIIISEISFDFMKETDPNEKILEIVIHTPESDEKSLLEKEDVLIDKIIDKYPKTMNEYILLVEC